MDARPLEQKDTIGIWGFLLLFLLFAVYLVSVTSGFYWRVTWLDLFFHAWGGVVASLLAEHYFGSKLKKCSRFFAFIFLLSAAAVVGTGWEFFEWLLDHTLRKNLLIPYQTGLNDTLGDLFMDVAGGGLVSWWMVTKRYRMRS